MTLLTARIKAARAFLPLLRPARYKVAWGGRGSAKSHFFAGHLLERVQNTQSLGVAAREFQNSIQESSKALLEAKIASAGLEGWTSLDTELRHKRGGRIIFIGLRRSIQSIKSLEGAKYVWTDEADRVSARSLEILRPTVRSPGSELWFGWNPQTPRDAVDALFRGVQGPPANTASVEVSWRDNPWWTAELEAERSELEARDPELYAHVYEGGYRTAASNGYYRQQIARLRQEGRLGDWPHDPAMPVFAAWDLGFRDATAIWFAQRIGGRLRIIDYVEGQGQELTWYIGELQRRPYRYEALILPHDAAANQGLGTRDQLLRNNGYRTVVLPASSVQDGIEEVRRMLASCQIADTEATKPGIEAIASYHEKTDPLRGIGLGPHHDWASHGADALRYLAVGMARMPTRAGGSEVKPIAPMPLAGGWGAM